MLIWGHIYIQYKSTLQIERESDFCGILGEIRRAKSFHLFLSRPCKSSIYVKFTYNEVPAFKAQFDLS